LIQRSFIKNIITLAAGSLMAQVIWFAFSLLLPHFYTPAEFGRFAVFLAVANILAIVAAMRYELAIVLAPVQEVALRLLGLSAAIILAFVVLSTAWGLSFPAGQPHHWPWLYAAAALLGLHSSLHFYLLREGRLADISISKLLFALGASAGQLLLAGIRPDDGLAIGYALGLLPANLFLMAQLRRFPWRFGLQYRFFRALAKQYFSLVKYAIPSQLLNALASNIQPILLLRFFSAQDAGFFFLAYRLVWAPLNLATNAIAQAYFREMAGQLLEAPQRAMALTRQVLSGVIALILVPLSVVLLWAPVLFSWLFGPDWESAGRYAQWMWVLFVGKALFHPISYLAELLNIVRLELVLNVYLTMAAFASMALGLQLGRIDAFILCYSISAGLGYFTFMIVYLWRLHRHTATSRMKNAS
jgi:O-antigen/teichoic acid export membrane protein